MDDKIINFPGITKLDIPPDRIAKALLSQELDSLVVCGFTKDGEFYFSSNVADAGTVMYFLETAKHKLLKICEEMEIVR